MSGEAGGATVTAERPITVPPTPAEGERQPERKLLNPGRVGAQAILLMGGTPSGNQLDAEKIKKVGSGKEPPDTTLVNKSSSQERDERWKSVAEDQRMIQWKNNANAFFGQYKDKPEKEFMAKIGIDVTGSDVAQAVYDRFFSATGEGKGDLGILAKKIAACSSDEINDHTELIRKIGKLYGTTSSEALLLLVEGLKNAEPSTVETFLQKAQEQLSDQRKVQDVSGYAILARVKTNATEWDKKITTLVEQQQETAAAKSTKPEGKGEQTDEDETSGDKLTPELATTNPELFKQLLIQHLAKISTPARVLLEYAIQHGDVILDELELDTSTWGSSINVGRHGITIGTKPMTEAEKHRIFVNDHQLSYADEVAYRLNHELAHALYHYMRSDDTMQPLLTAARSVREAYPGQKRGLTALASHPHYKPGDNKAIEDVTELLAMGLFDPGRLNAHLAFLKSGSEEEKSSLGLANIQNPEQVVNAVRAVHEKFFEPLQRGTSSTPTATEQT